MNGFVNLSFCILHFAFSSPSLPLLNTLDSLKESLKENPENGEIHFRLAEFYLQQREYGRAEEHLKTLLSLKERGEEDLLLSLGRISLKEKRYEEALSYLLKSERRNPELSLLLGHCAERLSRWEEAIGYYGLALESLLDDYSRFQIGQVLLEMGWTDEALTVYNSIMDRNPESPLLSRVIKEIPQLIEKEGRWEEAIAKREEIIENEKLIMKDKKLNAELVAEMKTGIARDLLELGKKKEAGRIYWDVIGGYPSTSSALEALRWLEKEDHIPSSSRFEWGRVYSLHRNYQEAIQNFQVYLKNHPKGENSGMALRLLADSYYSAREFEEAEKVYRRIFKSKTSPSPPAQVLFRIARCEERMGREKEAYNLFLELVNKFQNETILDDALYRSGMILEREGDYEGAIPIYERLVLEIPEGDYADDGWYRLGLSTLQSGDTDLAQFAFHGLLKSPSGNDSPHRHGALYWLGRIYEEKADSGRKAVADSILLHDFPLNYYTFLSQSKRSRGSIESIESMESIRLNDSIDSLDSQDLRVESWISTWAETLYTLSPEEENRFERGKRLLEMGFFQEGRLELSGIVEENPLFLYRLALLYKNAGLDYEPLLLAERIRQQSRKKAPLPHELLLLLYPAPYLPTLKEVSQEEPFEIPLYLSILRAESGFNPEAISPVGARGLAQIMPETGEKIAQVLNDTLYHVDDLFHPIKNIRFGTWYINALRDTLKEILQGDGEEDFIKPLVLASYNGGPHNVRDWVEKGIIKNGKFYPEPDSGSMKNAKLAMAIESIPFFETRDFVKRVLGNEEVYRRLLR